MAVGSGRREAGVAVACGAAALVVYVRTLAPGLTADVDTALFQFVGRVLGVGHNPGYPFYVLITHPFSYLPVGSLAYRMNLFSAFMGAAAVALTCLVASRLGCRPAVEASAGLGLAFSPVFWSQSLIAEVYSLHAAIVAAVVLLLLVWAASRRARWYYAAMAIFAAGLGNHTTILAFLPGIAGFVALTDRSFAFRPRTLLVSAGVILAGLLQYAFVLIRSLSPDAYVESRATTLPALVQVMLGRQFQDRLFTFNWRTVLVDRLPGLVHAVFVPSLTIPGLALAGVGIAWLLRRRRPEAVLLLPAALAVLAFALDYSVIDTPVFLIPTVLVLWLCAAVGAEAAARFAARVRRADIAVAAAFLVIPAWLFGANLRAVDRSHDIAVTTQVDPLFRTLPEGSALVREDFIADRLVNFKRLGEGAAWRRGIDQLPRDAAAILRRIDRGAPVFAFAKAAAALRFDALDVAFAPVRLLGGSLEQVLADLPEGTTVAIAVPARLGDAFTTSPGRSLDAIGASLSAGHVGSGLVIVGVRGAAGGALVQRGRGVQRCDLAAGRSIGATGRAASVSLSVEAGGRTASIRQGSREIVWTADGVAVAAWNGSGARLHAHVLQPAHAFRVPVATGPLSAYRVRGRYRGQAIGVRAWTDVRETLSTGTALLRLPVGAAAVIYVADDRRLSPRVFDTSARGRVTVAPYEGPASKPALRTSLDRDGALGPIGTGRNVYRIELNASEGVPVSVLLAFGGVPSAAIAREPGDAGHQVELFSVPTDGLLRQPDDGSELLLMSRGDQAQLTGAGWSLVESDAVGPYRWLTGIEARLLLPVRRAGARRIRVQALCTAPQAAERMALRLNDTSLPPQALQRGWHAYEWELPPGALVAGANEASVILDPPGDGDSADAMRVAVSDVRLVTNP